MFNRVALIASLAAAATAQFTSYLPGTGVRSLWIPYETVSGTPLASIASRDATANVTVYVLSCPTASPSCALAPNLTLTEGESMARYVSKFDGGDETISCTFTGTTAATCEGQLSSNGQLSKQTSTLTSFDLQAVSVTQTLNNTSTMPVTVTVTAKSSTTSSSSTSSSTAGVQTISSGPWAVGGALGAGLVALAAL